MGNEHNELGQLIRKLRIQRGISATTMSKMTNVSAPFIYDIERGKTKPSLSTIGIFADFFGVSVDYLLGRENSNRSENILDAVQSDKIIKSDMLKIPVLSREWTACCGNGIPTLDITNSSDEFIPWPRDDFRALDDMRPPFAIYVEGDCLESIDIRDGDKVIINPAEEPPQGTVALTRRHGVLALRYVYRLKSGGVILKCDLGTSTLSPDDIEESDFAILGTLVGTFHPRPPALPL